NWHVFVGQERFVSAFMDVTSRFGQGSVLRLIETLPWWSSNELDTLSILDERGEREMSEALDRAFVAELKCDDVVATAAYVVSSCMLTSQLLNRALAKFPDADCAVQINIDKNCVSMRARNMGGGGGENAEFDVARICASFGGGGH